MKLSKFNSQRIFEIGFLEKISPHENDKKNFQNCLPKNNPLKVTRSNSYLWLWKKSYGSKVIWFSKWYKN